MTSPPAAHAQLRHHPQLIDKWDDLAATRSTRTTYVRPSLLTPASSSAAHGPRPVPGRSRAAMTIRTGTSPAGEHPAPEESMRGEELRFGIPGDRRILAAQTAAGRVMAHRRSLLICRSVRRPIQALV